MGLCYRPYGLSPTLLTIKKSTLVPQACFQLNHKYLLPCCNTLEEPRRAGIPVTAVAPKGRGTRPAAPEIQRILLYLQQAPIKQPTTKITHSTYKPEWYDLEKAWHCFWKCNSFIYLSRAFNRMQLLAIYHQLPMLKLPSTLTQNDKKVHIMGWSPWDTFAYYTFFYKKKV